MADIKETVSKSLYGGLGRVIAFVNDPVATTRKVAKEFPAQAKQLPVKVATTALVTVYKIRHRNAIRVETPEPSPPAPSRPASSNGSTAPVATPPAPLASSPPATSPPATSPPATSPPAKAASKAPTRKAAPKKPPAGTAPAKAPARKAPAKARPSVPPLTPPELSASAPPPEPEPAPASAVGAPEELATAALATPQVDPAEIAESLDLPVVPRTTFSDSETPETPEPAAEPTPEPPAEL